jgi:hypothetical protein
VYESCKKVSKWRIVISTCIFCTEDKTWKHRHVYDYDLLGHLRFRYLWGIKMLFMYVAIFWPGTILLESKCGWNFKLWEKMLLKLLTKYTWIMHTLDNLQPVQKYIFLFQNCWQNCVQYIMFFIWHYLMSAFLKFFGRYNDLIYRPYYKLSLSHMLSDIFHTYS